jgi:hypothetical protein
MQDQIFTIFISHAAVDEDIALAIKEYIARTFPMQRVFVSSDPEDLKPGDEWVDKILTALDSSKFLIALTTERGLRRRWVWFESGWAWHSNVTLLPCCVGKVRRNGLPAPFSNRQAINIDEPKGASALFSSLQEHFGDMQSLPDYEEFVNAMIRLDIRADEKNKLFDDPFANSIIANIEKTMKTLSDAERETIKQFAIYGDISTSGVRVLVKATGINMERWSVPSALIERTGWLVSNPGNKPYDDMQQNVYSINPTVRPYIRAYFSK